MKDILRNLVLLVLPVLLWIGCGPPKGLATGRAHLAASRYEKAEAAYVSAAEKAPLEGWRGSCRARLLLGRFDAALDACERALAAAGGDKNVAALVLKGRVLRALGRHDKAVEALKAAHAGAPDSRETVAWLSMSLGDDLKRGDAVTTIRSWVDSVPDNAVRWAELATLQSYVYDLDDAEKSWRKVLDLAPKQAAAYVAIGEIHLFRGHVEDARRAAESSLGIDENHARAGLLLARILAVSGDEKASRKRLESVAPESTRSLSLLLGRAAVLRELGDIDGASKALDDAAAQDASDERIWYERGRAFEAAGDLSGAIEAYDKTLTIRPFHLEALWRVALASKKGAPDSYHARVLAFLAQARDVTALRPWVEDALARVPPTTPAPEPEPEPETTPATAPASAPATG